MSEQQTLVGVYPPARIDALEAALAQVRPPPTTVRIGHPDDLAVALHAEQQEEADRAFFSPQGGVLLPEAPAKVAAVSVPVAAAIGALVLLPVALLPMGPLDWWWRALWLVVIGAAAGATVAFIAGPAMASADPQAPALGERGVTVRVQGNAPSLREVLVAYEPIRLDQVAAGGTTERITTEEDRQPGGALEQTAAHVEREAQADPTERHR